ncbi:cobalt-precorrin-5B (C(1))-methyltransferase CbiD [Pseudobacteroides cellulosolvens]|uniref:Cobalt-precorrin-5B C(1)-methyltransferase n=1 Tax=Pseudobacteroides cellulosolvens ATCC 35603 = DSM 2933 TaxID=398512 RepID=A0A0L6JQE5_9FIRM|nr:cobalt-precorrin-5B (C(1))-methyltransferase CbiD [Pseudobacteroides cellulosolvens]KNY28013.1 cobalt-precorrin-6A synthase (deacetylating) [Pseudobacteroides cellulosolvens ATCC 35603 = DSM 2933]
MEDYVIVNGRKFKKGYTTGSCAAAAAKAAAAMLAGQSKMEVASIDTPAGIKLHLPIEDIEFSGDSVRCSVIKDGGDDPDITTGIKVYAEARYSSAGGIVVRAGEGIGKVTLRGLKVEVGQPAINPVPMRMIMEEVEKVITPGTGLEITISVPGGEELSQKTYNPKLGIVGGISILGTTGIVTPMSEEAWKEAVAMELSVIAASGNTKAVLTFGNYGSEFAKSMLDIDDKYIVKMSNFIGYILDKAVELGFKKLILVGHLGKLVKVAAGIFNTHSRVADARMEILAAYCALEGASMEVVKSVYSCTTTDLAAEIIRESGLENVFKRIVQNSSKRCMENVYNKLLVGTVLFNEDKFLLAMDENAEEILYGESWNGYGE